MTSNNLPFCYSCKRPTNELYNLATETDIDGIPYKTKLSSFVFKKLEERCEKLLCKVCVTQISTTYSFIRTLFEHNVVATQYINYELNKNPSTKLPMRISYGNVSQFECEQREEISNAFRRQRSSDSFSKDRNEKLNLTEYFKKKSPNLKRYSSGTGSVYGSSVNLSEIPVVSLLEDNLTQDLSASGVSDLEDEDLSHKEKENNSMCLKKKIKDENTDKDQEVVSSNDCSMKDANRNEGMEGVRSTVRCRKYMSKDEDMVVANSRKRRAAYNLKTFLDKDSDEENEQLFLDDTFADPSYKTGTFSKTIASISRGRRSKSKSPMRSNKRSKSPAASLKMQCPICEKQYNKSWYSNHLKTHSDVFDYHCEVCDQKFKIKTYLNRHMKNHEQLSFIKCAACAGVFRGVEALKEHLIAFHENVFRSAVCKLCGKNCKIAVNLNSHIAKHHLQN